MSFDRPYFLGITIGTDPEMAPRQPVAASPYAMRSVSTEALASSAAVPVSQLTGTLGTAQIADGAVTQPKLSATGAAAGRVLGTDGTNLLWQTTGGGGTVTAVTASPPLASTGGNTPQITLAGPIAGSLLASGLTLGGATTGTFSGPLTGNVTGNVTGNITGGTADFTGNLATGNVSMRRDVPRAIAVDTEPDNNTGGKSLTALAGSTSSSGVPFLAQFGGNLILQAGNGLNANQSATGGAVIIRSGANWIAGSPNGGPIVLETGAVSNTFVERVRVMEGGNVGIGTAAPA